jgi:hypothetical protein
MTAINFRIAAVVTALAFFSCNRQEKKTNIPDLQGISRDITYLDSLLQSPQIDSISTVYLHTGDLISQYTGRTQSPDEQAVLDSIVKINKTVNDFLRFCVDSRSNLELLKNDISATDIQYKTGKVNGQYYVAALVESEQVLVDINTRFTADRDRVLRSLKVTGILKPMLGPLPIQQ